MLFTLEALQADHGDCLLLHFGATTQPKLCVIDGGPRNIYGNILRPRLLELKKARSPATPLLIDIMMISHIDDDHVTGIVDLFMDLDGPGSRLYKITNLWFNSFDDILGKPAAQLASVDSGGIIKTASVGPDAFNLPLEHTAKLVVASVPQGRTIRDLARKLDIKVNKGVGGDLVLFPTIPSPIALVGGLSLTVAGPSKARLQNLQKKWDAEVKKLLKKGVIKTAAYVDNSVTNLSSIVVLAKSNERTILLTGDARGDDILIALREAGLLKGKTMPIDVLKMPHHGSVRDVAKDFFEALPANHYVASANGKYDNPDLETMKMLTDVRHDDKFTIHLTNHVPWLDKLFDDHQRAGRKYSVVYPSAGKNSVQIDLGDKLTQ